MLITCVDYGQISLITASLATLILISFSVSGHGRNCLGYVDKPYRDVKVKLKVLPTIRLKY